MALSFSEWMDHEASIPMQDANGEWYDLDTGIYFWEYNQEQTPRKPRYAPSEQVKTSRAKAKALGGRALRGTARQKEWAEKIRDQKLSVLSDEQKKLVLRFDTLHTAKFWIEKRDQNPSWFFELAQKLAQVIGAHNTLNRLAEESHQYDQKPVLSVGTSEILRSRDKMAYAIDRVASGDTAELMAIAPDLMKEKINRGRDLVTMAKNAPKPAPPLRPLYSRLASVRQSVKAINPQTKPLKLIQQVRELMILLQESKDAKNV